MLSNLDTEFWPAVKARRVLAGLLVALLGLPAPGDVFQLENGGRIEGQLIANQSGHYVIRTTVGTVRVPEAAVKHIEKAPSPFEEYEQRARQAGDTAEGQLALAAWCEEQGLKAEQRKHLLRAVELEPDYAPARRALGYVRVGQLWVDGRRLVTRPQSETADETEGERLARAVQGQWHRRIRAVKRSFLDAGSARHFEEGRARILEIRDPLAILPLCQVLATGNADCRALLIEALGAFPQDEATMNLGLLGLLDPHREIRLRALVELARRRDSRVTAEYRQALLYGDDIILARAAVGLGQLGAREAIPELIAALTVQRDRWVEVPVARYIGGWPLVFDGLTVADIGCATLVRHRPEIGVWYGQYAVVDHDVWNEWVVRRVTVYRTEVLEALKRLTGRDFGFDQNEWRRWYEQTRGLTAQ